METLAQNQTYRRTCVKGHDLESLKARLFSKIWPSSVLGCWEWLGAKDKRGRATVWRNKRQRHAARAMWEILNGDPGELCVLHRCDNIKCINPFHLFLGSQQDNIKDMISKGRQRGAVGIRNHKAKLTELEVSEIKRELREFHQKNPGMKMDYNPLIKRYGISHAVIWLIDRDKIWRHIQ